ncbi:MAG: formylmethanofuran dehydrogenase subunit E family protein [Dehalococcoidia bacterium]|nr:formylmethanofuran dehydrogenase subunit E family protein [Dehalococcoidia bacterium]
METLRIDPKAVDLDRMIDRGIHLHGHRGPFLIAGIRMGLLALELLGNSGYFGLEAESETGTVTPLSCLTDGVQIGSGCTLGKGNIRVTDARRACVHFLDKSGRRVTIKLRPKIYEGFLNGRLEEQSEVARDKPREELFIWETPQ